MDLAKRLERLGLELPPAPTPVASYVPGRLAGGVLQISGQLPMVDGRLFAEGRVGEAVSVEQATESARRCVLNGLAVANDVLSGDWSRFEAVVRVGVFVASGPAFTRQHVVANGASDLLAEVLGEAGRHARAAVGAVSLPLNAPVEVELTLALRP